MQITMARVDSTSNDSRYDNISTTWTLALPPVYVNLHYTLISIVIMKVHRLGRKEGEGGRGREGGRKKERGNERVVETGRDGLGRGEGRIGGRGVGRGIWRERASWGKLLHNVWTNTCLFNRSQKKIPTRKKP